MDIKETIQLDRKGQLAKPAAESFIRTMQKDLEASRKQGPAKKLVGQLTEAPPPAELPIAESAKEPVSSTQPSQPVAPAKPVLPKPPISPKPATSLKPAPAVKELEEKAKPVVKKGRLKFALIGLAVIIIIGGTGGFLYWWNYLRPIPLVATYYECQNFQCIEVEGEGTDQCLSDEDCQPTEPIVPDSLIPVDETETIELAIGQENLLLDELKSTALDEQATSTFKRILVKLISQTEKKYADLDTLISALEISLPIDILQAVAIGQAEEENYTLFFYSQPEGNRLGLVIDMTESSSLVQGLRDWERTIIIDLKPLLLTDKVPTAFTEDFQDNTYQDMAVRYINFPSPDLSIDYALVADKLVITTSRESMYAVIDALLGQ
jgi:hypothetical protein